MTTDLEAIAERLVIGTRFTVVAGQVRAKIVADYGGTLMVEFDQNDRAVLDLPPKAAFRRMVGAEMVASGLWCLDGHPEVDTGEMYRVTGPHGRHVGFFPSAGAAMAAVDDSPNPQRLDIWRRGEDGEWVHEEDWDGWA